MVIKKYYFKMTSQNVSQKALIILSFIKITQKNKSITMIVITRNSNYKARLALLNILSGMASHNVQ